MVVLQSASLNAEAEIFFYGVTHYAPEVFSSIEHVGKENAQVISKLEKLKEKNSEYEQSKLSTDQSIQRLKEVKIEYHAHEERIRLLVEEVKREKHKLSSPIRQGEVLHAQGLKHQQKTISLGDFLSSMRGKAANLTS